MCGRYNLNLKNREIFKERFNLKSDLPEEAKTRFNIAPGQKSMVIVNQGQNIALMMLWGLIPFWQKEAKGMINARAETISGKPWFKKSFNSFRCLVPATGFYEWTKVAPEKIPYHFQPEDSQYFSFAGLYSVWKDPVSGKAIDSFAIITTPANNLVGKIHNRMPAILLPEAEDLWITGEITDKNELLDLLKPYPEKRLRKYPVSKAINNLRLDSEELIKEAVFKNTLF